MKPKLTATYLGQRVEKRKGSPDWRHFAWTVTIECDGRTMDTPWKAGMAHCDARTKYLLSPARIYSSDYHKPGTLAYEAIEQKATGIPPTLFDVLYSLCMDAAGYDNARHFEDWCGEYGYDSDSREAERIHKACSNAAHDLRCLLGGKLYDVLCAMDEDALKAWCEADAQAVQS